MADLKTNYMGINLKNPLIVGASGLTSDLKTIKKLEKAGAGAIVCKSLFQEQIQLEDLKFQKEQHKYDDLHAEMITVYPEMEYAGAKEHLYWTGRVKEAVSIPVIGSLNAVNPEVWVEYAGQLAETGVDGLELNLYASPSAQARASQAIEDEQVDLVQTIKQEVSLPLSVKLSPFYTNLFQFAQRLNAIGVDGIVLFNRFFQSDIDIQTEKNIFPLSFSHKEDNRLSLRYTGLLAAESSSSICCNTGIHDAEDVIKMLLVGASAVQVVSTIYRNGIGHLSRMRDEILHWMQEKKYTAIEDFRGRLSREKIEPRDIWIYKRTQYVKLLMQSGETLLKKIF